MWMLKAARVRCSGHIPRMEEVRNAHKILVEKYEAKRPFGIILKWILEKYVEGLWTGFK